jgi:hypothetical protein
MFIWLRVEQATEAKAPTWRLGVDCLDHVHGSFLHEDELRNLSSTAAYAPGLIYGRYHQN